MKNYLMELNPAIAWNATHNLILSIGVIALFSFIFTLHFFWMTIALAFLGLMWYLLYRFELTFRTRRFERMSY